MGLRSSAPLAMFLYHYLHQIFDEVVLVQNLTGDVFEEIDRITSRWMRSDDLRPLREVLGLNGEEEDVWIEEGDEALEALLRKEQAEGQR